MTRSRADVYFWELPDGRVGRFPCRQDDVASLYPVTFAMLVDVPCATPLERLAAAFFPSPRA